MKKFAALLMSMTLLSSLALFVACGDSDKQENQGKLDGDFSTEATDEEVTAVLTKLQNAVDGNTFLGDTAAEDWSFGFDAGADVSFSMVGLEPGSGENAQVGANVHFDLGVGYKLIIGNSAVSGAGDLSVKGSGSVMGSNANYSAKIYNDADYLYMDMSSVPGYPKVKLTYETVMGAIGNRRRLPILPQRCPPMQRPVRARKMKAGRGRKPRLPPISRRSSRG